jgi:hypothetical protein
VEQNLVNDSSQTYYDRSSLVRFESRNVILNFKNVLAYYNSGVVSVNLKAVGLAPG